eukprot:3933809-Rhodomonas_salina.1
MPPDRRLAPSGAGHNLVLRRQAEACARSARLQTSFHSGGGSKDKVRSAVSWPGSGQVQRGHSRRAWSVGQPQTVAWSEGSTDRGAQDDRGDEPHAAPSARWRGRLRPGGGGASVGEHDGRQRPGRQQLRQRQCLPGLVLALVSSSSPGSSTGTSCHALLPGLARRLTLVHGLSAS